MDILVLKKTAPGGAWDLTELALFCRYGEFGIGPIANAVLSH